MGLKFDNGRLALQNITDLNWYYLEVGIGADSLPHLKPEQSAISDTGLWTYDTFVLLRADTGDLYKLGIKTNSESVIDFSLELYTTEPIEHLPFVKLFLKDPVTSLLYILDLKQNPNDGKVYPALNQAGAVPVDSTLLDMPFIPQHPALTQDGPCHSSASFSPQYNVLVNPKPVLPAVLVTEGDGKYIIMEDGKKIQR